MNFRNLRIGARLGGGFALVLLLLVCVAGLGLVHMSRIQNRLNEIAKENNREGELAAKMNFTVYDRMIALRNLVLMKDVAETQREVERIATQAKIYHEAETELNDMFARIVSTTPQEKAYMVKIRQIESTATPLMDEAQKLGRENKIEEATDMLIHKVRPVQRQWIDTLNELIAFEKKLNDEAASDADKAYAEARVTTVVVSVLAVALGMFAAWTISRGVTVPIRKAVAIAQTVAAGDLTSRIDVTSQDETGQLLQALKDMNEALVNIVGEVRGGTDTIASASQQIASGNADLSLRTEEQASSLEETASSMEELTSTVKQNADNARQVNQLAVSASEVAVKGGAVVSEVVQTMGAINDSARKIVDIIGVIDSIAFQTNILALNAALVEESAAASEALREQANNLTQVVSVFKLDGRHAAAVEPARTAMPKTSIVNMPKKRTAATHSSVDPLQVKRLASAGSGSDWDEF